MVSGHRMLKHIFGKTKPAARFTSTAEWSVAEDLEMFSKSNVLTRGPQTF